MANGNPIWPGSRRKYRDVDDFLQDMAAVEGWHPDIKAWFEKTRAELGRLQAIIDSLPRTADGVPVIPGMRDLYVVIRPFGVRVGMWRCELLLNVSTPDGDYTYRAPEMYSTRKAAEAAKEGNNDAR